MCRFCDVWLCVCVCVGFVICECFDNCVNALVICVLLCTVFCIVSLCIIFLFVTSVRTTAAERKLNCSK